MKNYRYVILGGGMVAGYAAGELVERGLDPGDLCIISADRYPPYERPPLSKSFLVAGDKPVDDILIHPPQFYADHGIDLRLETEARSVQVDPRIIVIENPGDRTEDRIGYEYLLLATGARPRRLTVPGADMGGIYYLRSAFDAERIRDRASTSSRVVVIGAGFIGMEVSAALAQRGLDVTLVFQEKRLMENFFSPAMSSFFENYYQQRGVEFYPGGTVESFQGEGELEGVSVQSGDVLPADMVVVGIGVEPRTEILSDTGLEVRDGLLVNEFLETDVQGVFAAGDLARYHDLILGRYRRIEHWDNAVAQGRHAARRMSGLREPFSHTPYLFSDLFDLSWELWGDVSEAERLIERGEVESGKFSAWWLKGNRVVAAFVMNRPEEERAWAQHFVRLGQEIATESLADSTRGLSLLTEPGSLYHEDINRKKV